MKRFFLPLALALSLLPASANDKLTPCSSSDSVGRIGSWLVMPRAPQSMMPYLSGIFQMSDSCLEPSLLGGLDPISEAAQGIKSFAASYGLRYDGTLSYNYASIAPSVSGAKKNFSSTNNELWATWMLAKSADNRQGIFLMLEADWGQGFNFNEDRQGAQQSLGSLSNPMSALRGGEGVFIPNLSLGYSGFDGKFVAMVGTLDLTNFLDQNKYSADWNGNLLNLSFNFNPALPLPWSNWGYMTAWQPNKNFYTLYATTGCNAEINHNPFQYISSDYWVHLAEMGFIKEDFLGMGPGVYRFIYTITRNAGKCGAGGAINFQQQLGKNNPLGFFTRVGMLDEDAASISGTKTSVTCGFVLEAPFRQSGWGSQSNNDQLALGMLWDRAAESEKPYTHQDEYGLELSAVIQLSPTLFIQPDIQYIFNPIHATDGNNGAFVFQLQTTLRF